jgi:hypothetical protein
MLSHQLDKSKVFIYEHKVRLLKYMTRFIINLTERAVIHDDSKFTQVELEGYTKAMESFANNKFGSEGYEKIKHDIKETTEHHYANNRHHPEHFENGINGMDLLDVLEMVADWKSASENKLNGSNNMMNSIGVLSEKYGISPQLTQIIINTANNCGMI